MKVRNITSHSTGRAVPNQFIIITDAGRYFQSYDSIIVFIPSNTDWAADHNGKTQLDEKYWDYSVTTGRYRNQFLGETRKETQVKIDSGEYVLTDLNK